MINESTPSRRSAIASLAAAAAAFSAVPLAAQTLDNVTVGLVNTSSDAPFFLADRLGYFRDAGIAVKLLPFDGAPKMIAPLGAGQLDVGSGAPSAGLYNAISAKIKVKMVADKGSCPANFGYGPLMVRKDLVTSGKYKSVKDLKGMKFAESAPGSVLSSTINRLMKSAGLGYNDVQHVYLGFPAQVLAFAGGSIDAALTAEPSATVAERQGVAVRIMGNDKWYPGQEQSVVQYGSSFLETRHDVAMRFMVAYVRGARYFCDALVAGHIKGRNAAQIIDILCDATGQKDKTIYSDMVSNAVHPDGRMNAVSLAEDLNFFKILGVVQGDVSVAQATDASFQEAALAKLGPYKPNHG